MFPSLALGQLADYRVELNLATARGLSLTQEQGVFVGTPLDNLVHQIVRYEVAVESGALDEAEDVRHYLTGATLYGIFVDSFVADVILWIPIEEDQATDSFNARINSLYPKLFEQFRLTYTTLSGSLEEKLDQSRREISEWEAIGSQPSINESSEEES